MNEDILARLERDRKAALSKSTAYQMSMAVSLVLAIASVIGMIFGFSARAEFLGFILLLVAMITLTGCYIFYAMNRSLTQEFVTHYGKSVAEFLLSEPADYQTELSYSPAQTINKADYIQSRLYPSVNSLHSQRYEGKHLIKGKLYGVEFKTAHVDYSYYNRHKDRRFTLFKGQLVMIAAERFGIHGQTQILQDMAERNYGAGIGHWFQSISASFGPNRLLVLEDRPNFEHHFVIYSSNQPNARKLLSPALTEHLVAVQHTKRKVSISLQAAWVYIGWEDNLGLISSNLSEPINERKLSAQRASLQELLGFIGQFVKHLSPAEPSENETNG